MTYLYLLIYVYEDIWKHVGGWVYGQTFCLIRVMGSTLRRHTGSGESRWRDKRILDKKDK